jgi:hypothetical protein
MTDDELHRRAMEEQRAFIDTLMPEVDAWPKRLCQMGDEADHYAMDGLPELFQALSVLVDYRAWVPLFIRPEMDVAAFNQAGKDIDEAQQTAIKTVTEVIRLAISRVEPERVT